ncbi:15406_t:CDS:2 [Gigaspora margarita]|uniref:15406_t:CDS:1 n=1 Tax=Gigaspora margarita TaxID=4874 RepID=A0ABN7VCM5_GIGMA|nr:15406_t:CDS:2 [Gigaspora margarita]
MAQVLKRPFIVEPDPAMEDVETKVARSLSSESESVKDYSESEGTFDKFEYDKEVLEKAKRFYIENITDYELFQNPWKLLKSCGLPS